MTRPADLVPGQTIRRMGDDATVIRVDFDAKDVERPYRVVVLARWSEDIPENYSTIHAPADYEFRH